jgi:hypothetical protein
MPQHQLSFSMPQPQLSFSMPAFVTPGATPTVTPIVTQVDADDFPSLQRAQVDAIRSEPNPNSSFDGGLKGGQIAMIVVLSVAAVAIVGTLMARMSHTDVDTDDASQGSISAGGTLQSSKVNLGSVDDVMHDVEI